jgi:hypothetical protein
MLCFRVLLLTNVALLLLLLLLFPLLARVS